MHAYLHDTMNGINLSKVYIQFLYTTSTMLPYTLPTSTLYLLVCFNEYAYNLNVSLYMCTNVSVFVLVVF